MVINLLSLSSPSLEDQKAFHIILSQTKNFSFIYWSACVMLWPIAPKEEVLKVLNELINSTPFGGWPKAECGGDSQFMHGE